MGRPFQIDEVEEEGRVRLALAGELDLATAPRFQETLVRLCESGVREVQVDLGEIDFMDSTGLRAILRAKESCASAGIEFLLVPSRAERHRRLFELTGLRDVLLRRGHGQAADDG